MNEQFLNDIKKEEQEKTTTIKSLVSELEKQQAAMAKITAKLDGLSDFHWELDANAMGYLKSVDNGLKTLKIPKEVTLKKEVAFSEITQKVLVLFFAISIPLVCGSIGYGYYQHQKLERYKTNAILPTKWGEFSTNQVDVMGNKLNWYVDYEKTMKKKNPKSHGIYIQKHPKPVSK